MSCLQGLARAKVKHYIVTRALVRMREQIDSLIKCFQIKHMAEVNNLLNFVRVYSLVVCFAF